MRLKARLALSLLTLLSLVGPTGRGQVPKTLPLPTILDHDHQFDAGSKITLPDAPLTSVQIENLAKLGRVWGFLKYHHPKVTAGHLHWDYELFRVLPAVLAAADRAAANEVLTRWIDQLGELTPGPNPPLPGTSLDQRPDLAWLDDRALLGGPLSEKLQAVHAARTGGQSQFYLSLAPNIGNPVFDHELAYPTQPFPDAGYRLLALFRFWNIIRYWAPYRNLIDENWDAVLAEFIPRLSEAASATAYQRTLIALIAKVGDTHANLWSGLNARPPAGNFKLPAAIRIIEGRATVVHVIATPRSAAPSALQRGDLLLAIDGTPVEKLIAEWSPYYADSNQAARLRDIGGSMGRGAAGPVALTIQRGDTTLDLLDVNRIPVATTADPEASRHDLPGPAFRLLSPAVAYLKLSAVKVAEVKKYLEQAAGTQGWIIDLRNYPAEFVVFALGAHFVEQPTEFATFTTGDLKNPGAFAFNPKPVALSPQTPRYSGKIVILIDEISQSSAEYHAMAFRVAPGAVVVGSTTAGADGNVSNIPLPGGQRTMISGIGVFYPDKRPTQRIGILPDIEAHPTLAGLRAGRDEVLEVGLRQILGAEKSDAEIRQLVPPPL